MNPSKNTTPEQETHLAALLGSQVHKVMVHL